MIPDGMKDKNLSSLIQNKITALTISKVYKRCMIKAGQSAEMSIITQMPQEDMVKHLKL